MIVIFVYAMPISINRQIIIIILDQLTKYLIKSIGDVKKEIVKGFFNLEVTRNTGAGFGLLKDQTTLLIIASSIIFGTSMCILCTIVLVFTKSFVSFFIYFPLCLYYIVPCVSECNLMLMACKPQSLY